MKGELMVGGGLETAETERTRKMSATWSATQVCLRGVKAGLGGHDAGVSGGDAGVEDISIPISKRGRLALSESPTFSGFWPFEVKMTVRGKKNSNMSCLIRHVLDNGRFNFTTLG